MPPVAPLARTSCAALCLACNLSTYGELSSVSEVSNITAASDPGTGVPTGSSSSTTGSDTTLGVDPGNTSDGSTTTTDPTTTSTGVDPTTPSTGVDPTSTGDSPIADPQPLDGLYESCLDNTPCNVITDGCFTITDAMTMKVIDGYCTLLCQDVADCGLAPKAPAVQECLTISLNPAQKVCALKCTSVADCPTGMACTNLALPDAMTGSYCI